MHRYLNKEDGLEELAVGGDGHQGRWSLGQVAAGQMAGQVADRKEGQEAPGVRRIGGP